MEATTAKKIAAAMRTRETTQASRDTEGLYVAREDGHLGQCSGMAPERRLGIYSEMVGSAMLWCRFHSRRATRAMFKLSRGRDATTITLAAT